MARPAPSSTRRHTPDVLARSFRSTLAKAILVAGSVYALPTQVDSSGATGAASAGYVPAAFQVTARRGALAITGHTASGRHESHLRRLAGRHYPDHELRVAFSPLGLVPDWWEEATMALLATMASATSPSVELTEETLTVSALAADTAALEVRLEAIRPLLPEAVSTRWQILPRGPAVTARELCRLQFGEFEPGPIYFEESGTRLRTSAFPELDRIIMLADTCRDASVTITGHTDASGDETFNRQLSLRRARAVASYLAERGILTDNMITVGAGSSMPVADNGTRYGRSLNRRIEVRFSYDDESVASGEVSLTSSISNSSVAFGGTGGLPRSP